jgi:predicted site-specific integrase-resolvase
MTLLAPRDAARRLGLSVSRLVQLDRERILPAMRDSSGRRSWDPEIVEAYAQARERRRVEQGARVIPKEHGKKQLALTLELLELRDRFERDPAKKAANGERMREIRSRLGR